MPLQAGSERRVFERFWSRFPAKVKDAREDFGTNVFLRNASAEGVKITIRERLYLNDNITLQVNLPDGKDPLDIKGQVVWAKQIDPQYWDIGIQFHQIRFMHLWRLYELAHIAHRES